MKGWRWQADERREVAAEEELTISYVDVAAPLRERQAARRKLAQFGTEIYETYKPMVIVQESDVQHGHVPLEVHKSACPADLRKAFDDHTIVPWYRIKQYQNVSIGLILKQIMLRPGSCNGSFDEGDEIRIGDAEQQRPL